MPRKRPQKYMVGPLSQPDRIINADQRSREGRALQNAIDDLTDHCGGAPNAAEKMLIQSTAIIWLRIAMMAGNLTRDVDPSPSMQTVFLNWNNALRKNLQTLGLQPAQVKQVNLRLADIVEVASDD